MRVVGSIGMLVLPISLYGCGGGFLDEDDAGPVDGVESDRALDGIKLWGVALAGRRCQNGRNKLMDVKTVHECQQKAVDAGVQFFSYKVRKSGPACLVVKKCSMLKDHGWTTYVKPVPGHPADTCPTTTCTTTTTSTYAPWTHVEIHDFNKWKDKCGLQFENAAEEALRMKIFTENTKAIVHHNKGSNKWWKAQNCKFTHLLQSEFEEILTFDESLLVENSDVPVFEGTPSDDGKDHGDEKDHDRRLQDLQDDDDGAARHWSVSPVKDQLPCGSCWAFAAVASMEAAARVHLGRTDILSEQQVMDCTSSDACTNRPGNIELAYRGIVGDVLYSGSSYPYLLRNGVCHEAVDSGLRIISYIKSVPISATDADMIAGLNNDPLVVHVDASSWNHYGGAIHHDSSSCNPNHQVLATGYDKEYFKLKNSWGQGWGEDGYIRIARNEGACGTDGTSAILRHGGIRPIMRSTASDVALGPIQCTCEFTSNNIQKVYVDGEDVTLQVSGDLNSLSTVKSLSFTCDSTTLLAVQASAGDAGGGCSTGDFALKCSASGTHHQVSPWNGLVSGSSWKAWGGSCSSPGCESGVSSPPTDWFLPSFDDLAWDGATIATEQSSVPVVGISEGICSPDGPGWLFRSPHFPISDRCFCELTSDNYIQKVYVDGEDVTSQVSGDLKDFRVVKTLSFTCGATTALAVQASDAEGGCSTGSFTLKCSAGDPRSPFHGMVSDSSWKAWGGPCSSPGCALGVSSPPTGWYLRSFDDLAWDNAVLSTPRLAGVSHGICNPDGAGWLFRSPRFAAFTRCSCEFNSNNYIQKVYVDGEDVTSQVSGDLNTWRSVKSLSFACSATTLLAVQASDGNVVDPGCSTGSFTLKCSADDTSSSWNGMVSDGNWKAWGGSCSSPACESGASSPPTGWFLPSFDASAWDNAAIATDTAATSVLGTPTAICDHDGPGWLFRSPRCSCEFNSNNFIQKVFIDGEDVTSQVSGDRHSWSSVNSLSFVCSTATLFAVQASDGDANGGCSTGSFALKCSADDTSSPWHGLVSDGSWKSWGGSCSSLGCLSGASSPPTGWYLPSFDDSAWDNAAIATSNLAATEMGASTAICDPTGQGWLFRSPNFGR